MTEETKEITKSPEQIKNEKVYHIYAALGELSVREKQANQLIDKIISKRDALEQELAKILGASDEQ